MAGVGITPEGIFQNYIMYNFALEQGWHQNSFNVSKWIDEYVFTRYGIKNDNVLSAWQKLHVSISYSLIKQLFVSFEIKNQKVIDVIIPYKSLT